MRSSSRGSQRPDIAAGITDWTNLLDPSKWTYEELKTFLVKYGKSSDCMIDRGDVCIPVCVYF